MIPHTPRASILVPVYNCEPVVADTLASAVEQGPDVEILALDDGSTDRSADVVASFAPRVRHARQPNRGVSAARNALLSLARADWLVFLDADDVLLPGAVDRALAVASATGADVVCANWRPLREQPDGTWLQGDVVDVEAPGGNDPALAVFDGWWLPPGAVLVRRSWAERVGGFRGDLPVIQDARFLFDLARHGARIAASHEVGLLYRERLGISLSRRNPHAFWRDCLLNAEQVEASYLEKGSPARSVRASLLGGFELVARALGPTDRDSALRALRGAFRQIDAELRPSRWLRVALATQPFLGARLACWLSARLSRVARRWAS